VLPEWLDFGQHCIKITLAGHLDVEWWRGFKTGDIILSKHHPQCYLHIWDETVDAKTVQRCQGLGSQKYTPNKAELNLKQNPTIHLNVPSKSRIVGFP
jgi:hypothetical protein